MGKFLEEQLKKKYQVIGIGNAMVDVLAEVNDDFLIRNNIEKGIMQLTDRERGVYLSSNVNPIKEVGILFGYLVFYFLYQFLQILLQMINL